MIRLFVIGDDKGREVACVRPVCARLGLLLFLFWLQRLYGSIERRCFALTAVLLPILAGAHLVADAAANDELNHKAANPFVDSAVTLVYQLFEPLDHRFVATTVVEPRQNCRYDGGLFRIAELRDYLRRKRIIGGKDGVVRLGAVKVAVNLLPGLRHQLRSQTHRQRIDTLNTLKRFAVHLLDKCVILVGVRLHTRLYLLLDLFKISLCHNSIYLFAANIGHLLSPPSRMVVTVTAYRYSYHSF